MNLMQMLDRWRSDSDFMSNVAHWKTLPPRTARYDEYPEWLNPKIINALKARGVHKLYTHQVDSLNAAHEGVDYAVVTPTASGKTMCYNLPVLSSIIENPQARALYLFPTKRFLPIR